MSEPYVPRGEDLRFERSMFAGAMLATLGYGVFLCVTSATMYMMLSNFAAGRPPSRLVLCYTFLLTCGATVFTGTNWRWAEILFIYRRDYPGGPPNAFYELFHEISNVCGNIALFFNMALVESLLLWRLYIIWNARFWVMIVPSIWFLATVGLAVMTLVRSSLPNVDPRDAVDYAVPYFISSVLLNLTLTVLIAGRLLYLRRSLTGGAPASTTYFSLASLLVESALLQSLLGIATCVSFVVDQATATFLVIILGEVVCIGPMMILMRVAWGSGFQHSRSMRFASGTQQLPNGSSHGGGDTRSVVSPATSRSPQSAYRKGTLTPGGINSIGHESLPEEIHLQLRPARDDRSYLPGV